MAEPTTIIPKPGQEGFLMATAPTTIRNQFTKVAFKIGGGARHGIE
jgi:hypothetical protein